MQLRVLVPQFAVAVGRPVQNFARQRFAQRLALFHVRAIGLQVLHQHFGLSGKLCPVHLAAVGLCPAAGQPFNVALAHLHAPCQPKELAQRVQRCRLVRNGPARRLLVVLLCVPAGLLRQLIVELRKAAFLCQLSGPVIVPDFPHYAVGVHAAAVLLAGCHPAVRGGDVQRELPARAAQFLRHSPDLFQLLRSGCHVCRKVDARPFRHHAHVAVQQKFIQRFGAGLHFCRAEHVHDCPVVGVPGAVILGKVQHLAIRQDVPCPVEVLGRAELLLCQRTAVFCLAAVGFSLCIIRRLFCFAFCRSLLLHPGTGRFDPVVQRGALVIQLRHPGIVVLALCKVALVFFAVPVGFRFCRKDAQCFLLRFDCLHCIAFQPGTAFFLQGPPLLVQLLLFIAQLRQLVCLAQLIPHIFLQRPVISLVFGGFLCYTCVRRYFLSSHSAAPHIHREMCGSIFFFCRFSGIVKCHITTIRPTHFVCIKSFSAVFSCVRVHNYRFVDSGFIHNYRPSKNICVIALALPVFFISNLIAVTNHSRNSCNRSLLCCTISMTHCFIRAIML